LITADDVKKFIDHKPQAAHTSALTGETEALHGVRRVMAQAMQQSNAEIVPVTIIEDVDISNLPPKTDITVRVLNAIIAAVKEEPALNAWFDGRSLERKLFKDVHIGLAVDSAEGLIVPVIKNAETKSPEQLRSQVDEYKKTVSTRTVSPKDLQGCTITLSNFGMIAGKYATPIIVPPTVAILGCGRSREAPVVRNGEVKAGKIMPLSLTFDHRAVTGGEATRFLGALIKHIEGGNY